MNDFFVLYLKTANIHVCEKIKLLRQEGVNITEFIEHAILHMPIALFIVD